LFGYLNAAFHQLFGYLNAAFHQLFGYLNAAFHPLCGYLKHVPVTHLLLYYPFLPITSSFFVVTIHSDISDCGAV